LDIVRWTARGLGRGHKGETKRGWARDASGQRGKGVQKKARGWSKKRVSWGEERRLK